MAEKTKSTNPPVVSDPRLLALGKKIKHLRDVKGPTSYERFAWENNFSRVQYYRIEKGENITLKSLLKVLDIHKISLAEFFSDIAKYQEK